MRLTSVNTLKANKDYLHIKHERGCRVLFWWRPASADRPAPMLHHARLLHRPAMVVPGPVTSVLSVGCHAELREHPQTRLVRDTADVIAELTTHTDGPA